MRIPNTIFDRSLIYEAGGKGVASVYRREKIIHSKLQNVDIVIVSPSTEDFILPTGQVLSGPDHDVLILLNRDGIDYVEDYLEANNCLPIKTGDSIRRDGCPDLHITRVNYESELLAIDVEEEIK